MSTMNAADARDRADLDAGSIEERSTLLAWGGAFVLTSAVIVAGVLGSVPLPIFGGAAAFLFLAVRSDIHANRIPNALTLPALALALVVSPLVGGAASYPAAFAGAGLALAIGVVPYALGGVGAGDVKAMMALGAWLGGHALASTTVWAVLAGAVFALVLLGLNLELGSYFKRWGQNLWLSVAGRSLHYEPPARGSKAAHGIPFAVAIAAGLALHWTWGPAW